MVNYSSLAITALVALAASGANAFTPSTTSSSSATATPTTFRNTDTSLNVMPPMIIGPMIRKMKEEKAKQKMPMATADEALNEAPGLRVGEAVWKWPPVWPYDPQFFVRKEEIVVPKAPQLDSLAGMMSGMPQQPVVPEEPEVEVLDLVKYWTEDKADVRTEIDPEAIEKLKSHYAFYLRDGMSILELGAAENSYLPDGLKPSRHIGVGLSTKLMAENPALTDTMVVDLNDCVEEQFVNSEELRGLAAEPFDAIIMANTIDFLTSPREVFRTAWELLKPGGVMIVPFASKDAYTDKFGRAQTKMWADMNNDQHLWVCGSFFQFSAGDGWEGLKGFDISPEGAGDDDGPLASLMNRNKPMNMYVCQGTKGFMDDSIDEENPEKSFGSKMWMLPTMEDRDKKLVAPRLVRAYEAASTEEEKNAIVEHVNTLPKVYEGLIKMDQFAFTFNMQAQLAVDLVADPDFVGNDEQIRSLKQGLGLLKPTPEFWLPVGQKTAAMNADEKINLLAHVVPRFGSGDPEQEKALQNFATGLSPTFEVIKTKCPDLKDADVQLVGTELLAAEILKPGRSTKSEFATWLAAMTVEEIDAVLTKRKSFKQKADAELEDMRTKRAKRQAEIEATRKAMEAQIDKARAERTMAFNPRSGKMELIPKKDDEDEKKN
mmetsp:Transcript_4209/g.6386  ORF Transcript_4209/g.6386 Transcript_4209/m.6386 type:complete len:659 (+) Transcript_4209:162-2138(+)|eukprot:CAMPEP_0195288324 /NCGR_PEP_ID=MMETSP0707-20130614/5035_1 /TAXON_ID=33640 /ORGANISM="Asterionellopsis glacialis, Strain CCMP134" /LENGTH=658 /DNA_ID=CAMNT_0040348187 /DNA_START=111 /DNA_END=2087 /DNA_ORIENTATION=+